ncbi:MAG: HPr-rel-A system PqqD family peptide chaperone [Streptosporangiaceae bacterium]
MEDRPKKNDGLEIDEVEDGFVVYQPDRARVHYLNPTAKLILELCDGTLTAAQIAGLIEEAFGLSKAPRQEVGDALAKLETEGLVQ